jgi:hypothetical protein
MSLAGRPALFSNPSPNPDIAIRALALSYSEHLGSTRWTGPLSRRSTILHSYGFGIFHFPFGLTFHTICLHLVASLFGMNDNPFSSIMSTVSLELHLMAERGILE